MSWEQDLSGSGIAIAEIAGATILNVAAGGTMGPSIFGACLSAGVPALMGMFGLGNSGNSDSPPDYTPYFKAIQNQLSGMETAVLQNLSDIQESINWIQAGITTIELDIQDDELQGLLTQYSEQKNVITPLVEEYANALGAIGANSANSNTAQTMFDLLSNNANAVATALLNIHTLVYGQGELKGILDFQAEVCQSAMASWASTANFQSFAGHNQNTSGYGPNNGPGCDCSQLVTVPPATLLPQAITGSVIPTFQAILNSMGQGLMFLGAAWQNTLNDNLLTQHISNIRAVVQKMNSFWTGYSNPAALDTFVCTLVNSYKQTCGDLGTLTDVTNPNNTVPGTQPFSNDWVFWFLPPSQDFSDPWYSISSGVVNIGPTVTSLGGSYAAYRLGVGWGEGNGGGDVASRIWGLVCASASVTIPVPGSLFPSAPPADLSAFLNVVQGAVTPSLIVVYPGMAPQGLISNVLGQAPSTATWSIEPSDGSAGSVANQAGNPANATYSAPATVASPFLGSIVVTLNGAVTLYVPLVLLPLQPTIQVTPTATLITPPNPVSFKASVPGCDWTLVPAGVGSIDGQGNYTPPPAVDTPTSIVVVASTSSPAAVGFACVCVAPPS